MLVPPIRTAKSMHDAAVLVYYTKFYSLMKGLQQLNINETLLFAFYIPCTELVGKKAITEL